MANINIEALKKAGLSFEEIESVKQGFEDVENGRTISHNEVKLLARNKILSNAKVYA